MRSPALRSSAAPIRLHVEAPGHGVDVVVPPTVTAAELLLVVVDLLGGWDRLDEVPAGWILRTAAGHTLPAGTPIGEVGLHHGDTLRLVAWVPEDLEPVVDDVVAEMADGAAALSVPWSPASVFATWAVVVSWVAAGWVLLDRLGRSGVPLTSTPTLVTTAAAVAVALGVASWWRSRREDRHAATTTLAALPWWALAAGSAVPSGATTVAAAAAIGIVAGGGVALAVARGRDAVALAAVVAGVTVAAGAGIGRLVHASDARTAGLVAVLGLLAVGVLPWFAGGGLTDDDRDDAVTGRRVWLVAEVRRLAGAAVGRLAAARAGALAGVVAAWPVLATSGGIAAPVLGLTTAAVVLLAARHPAAGPARTVSAVSAALAGVGLIGPVAALAAASSGVGAGVAVAAGAVLVARVVAGLPAPVRAGLLTRAGILEVLAAAAVPALLVTVWGGYSALAAVVRGIVS